MLILLAIACGPPGPNGRPLAPLVQDTADMIEDPDLSRPEVPNLLLIVADDVGVDKIASYNVGDRSPPTPTLDGLIAEGIQFDRAYANPVCSPTRSLLLTGRHGFRTGIGLAMQPQRDDFALNYDEWTLPELLDTLDVGYSHAALGKWHLGTWTYGGSLNPQGHGFGYHAGSMANFQAIHAVDGLPQSYYDWEKSVDGVLQRTTVYATTDTTNDTIAQIENLPEPWFLWVAYNAAHDPFHVPPEDLHGYVDPTTHYERYNASLEALDTELGRLMDSVDLATTTVIFIGDNGTPGDAVEPPLKSNQAKKTLFEGGIHVPLIVAGASVHAPGSRVQALVNATDIYATLGELAGARADSEAMLAATDSISFAPYLTDPNAESARETVYNERFDPVGFGPYDVYQQAIRDKRFKLHRYLDGTDHLYDLEGVDLEGADLLLEPLDADAEEAYERLSTQLTAYVVPESAN